MNKYKVLIEGNNFIVCLDGKTGKYGFFTTRFVEAQNIESAEASVTRMIKDELKPVVLNDISDPPTIYAEEIHKIDDFGENIVPGSGFTWFESEETIH